MPHDGPDQTEPEEPAREDAASSLPDAGRPTPRGLFTLAALLDLDEEELAQPLPRIAPTETRWEHLTLGVAPETGEAFRSTLRSTVPTDAPLTDRDLIPGLEVPGAVEVPVYLAGRTLTDLLAGAVPYPASDRQTSAVRDVAAKSAVSIARTAPARAIYQIGQNVAIALSAIRASKLRSALTVLGVVIGVCTVMTMASLVQGIRDQIVRTIEIAGPTTFYVLKVFTQTPVNPDQLPKYIRVRPDLTLADAERIRQLPGIRYAALWGQAVARVEYGGSRTQNVAVFGTDEGFTEIQGGELASGRWFTHAEVVGGDAVVVLRDAIAERVFGMVDPLDKMVRVGGRPARVVGIYVQPGNIFSPPGSEIGAIVPFRMLDAQFKIDRTNALWIPVKPKTGVTVTEAQANVTVAMRSDRKLRPRDKNTFDLVTQDQVLDTFNSLTSVFFLVLIVLSSVALLVGGIGVMAIMMVSVTDRTKEIGLRKALGATNGDIRLQFLVEAATLTGLGGMIGVLTGAAIGKAVTMLLDITTGFPVTLTAIAVASSIVVGVLFGLIPANRAARLDPVEALRYE